MDRRTLLQRFAWGLAGFAAGGGLAIGGIQYGIFGDARCASWPRALASLHDARFLRALPELNIDQLLAQLAATGIYSQGCFNIARLSESADTQPLLAFDGFYYTEPELALYALVARLAAVPELAAAPRETKDAGS